MNPRTALLRLLFAATIALGACSSYAQQGPQARLPEIQLQSGLYLIKAEVANSEPSRMTGMMMRTQMGTNEGMLFLFTDSREQCMWMRNTLLPLSVAFMGQDGTILNVEDMKAQTDDTHCSKGVAPYALEMNLGWFRKKGIKAGTRILGLEKAGPPR